VRPVTSSFVPRAFGPWEAPGGAVVIPASSFVMLAGTLPIVQCRIGKPFELRMLPTP
jgi:hypothetical protein